MIDAVPSGAATVTYSSSQIVTPPSSAFTGAGGGGDGWGVALSSTKFYNVFHHQKLAINCHLQSDASTCDGFSALVSEWKPVAGGSFGTSAQPEMYLDQETGYLYVFATRSDSTVANQPGVACFNTNATPSNSSNTTGSCTGSNGQPAAWTPLGGSSSSSTGVGSANGSVNGVFYNGNFYAYNFYPRVGVSAGGGGATGTTNGQNNLLCYNIASQSPCDGEPYAINFGSGANSSNEAGPGNAETLIGSKLFIPSSWNTVGKRLACVELSGATPTNCLGSVGTSWPQTTGDLDNTAPIPYLDSSGVAQGVCFKTTVWTCWGLDASPLATPSGLTTTVIGGTMTSWTGAPITIGTKCYSQIIPMEIALTALTGRLSLHAQHPIRQLAMSTGRQLAMPGTSPFIMAMGSNTFIPLTLTPHVRPVFG